MPLNIPAIYISTVTAINPIHRVLLFGLHSVSETNLHLFNYSVSVLSFLMFTLYLMTLFNLEIHIFIVTVITIVITIIVRF